MFIDATLQKPNGDSKRRSACYKPNIWSNAFIDSLNSDYKDGATEREVDKLKNDLMKSFNQEENSGSECRRQFIKTVIRLGLSDLFEKEFREEGSGQHPLTNKPRGYSFDDYQESQLQKFILPLNREVPWFEVRKEINKYKHEGANFTLLSLSALNFNTVQAIHKEELKYLAQWRRNLGLTQEMSFTRDQLVESFLLAVGVAHQPQYSCLRTCLTKVITFILLIDDIYDIYGFLDELECFTRAVERWDLDEVQLLPESLKTCFTAFYETTNDMAEVIQEETGRSDAFSLIRKAWVDFCKSLLIEARWYYASYTPSLTDYLSSAWISSSGPLLSIIVDLLSTQSSTHNGESRKEMQETLIYNSSLIIRLCNDLQTSKAELRRGDSPSSILCYMKDKEVTEDVAKRELIDMIQHSWDEMGKFLVKNSLDHALLPEFNLLVNIARVACFIYSKGDGIGVQDGSMQEQVKCILVEPVVYLTE